MVQNSSKGQFVHYCQLLLSFVLTGGISLSIVFLHAFLGHSWGQILYSFTVLLHLDVNNYNDVNHARELAVSIHPGSEAKENWSKAFTVYSNFTFRS